MLKLVCLVAKVKHYKLESLAKCKKCKKPCIYGVNGCFARAMNVSVNLR